jgi:hypothetical protein
LTKKIKIFIFAIIIFSGLSWLSFAQNGSWWDRGSDPLVIFESMVDEANNDGYAIQETALDGISDQQWWYAKSYKISNTLDYVRKNLDPYLQWIIYTWLVLATIWLIYIGFLLTTNALHKQWDWTKMKTSIMHILLWVFILSWFYLIIKVMVALITSIFWWENGSTGY